MFIEEVPMELGVQGPGRGAHQKWVHCHARRICTQARWRFQSQI